MASNIKVPDFDFSVFYYPEILEELLKYKRDNIPEITTENPFDPGIQLLRAFALIGHLNNTLLDLVAQEVYIGTSNLRESVARQLKLIAYDATGNIPASAVLRMELTQGFTSATVVVPDNASFGTRRRADTPEVLFEADEQLIVQPTDEIDGCWLYDNATETWTDKTTEANTDASTLTFTAAAEGHLYLAHNSIMTDTIEFSGVATGLDIGDNRAANPRTLHFQYFDGNVEDARPDSVTFPGSVATAIRFDIDDLVGTDSKIGTHVYVTLNETGAQQRLAVQNDGTNYIETDGFLGQSVVSTDPEDYTVGSYWHDVEISTDTTKASPPQETGEAFDTGDAASTTFGPNTLDRWPLAADTIVEWSYESGGVPKTAGYDMSDGSLIGDAAVGTTVDPDTGIATLEATSVPDASAITVSYYRAEQTLQQDGEITFAVPMTDTDDWTDDVLPEDLRSSTGPDDDGFWFRLVISEIGALGAGAVADLVFDRVRWDRGKMYLRVPVTQGETVSGELVGSGDGSASQSFTLDDTPVIDGSVQFIVDDEPWTEVDDFFASDETDEHFTVSIDTDGVATIETGDGTNGKVVPTGTNNVEATYRVGGAEDGNVGPEQIIVNRSGLSRVRAITNPRAAQGWTPQEGSGDEIELERFKRNGISSLRTSNRGVSPPDIQYLTTRFQADDGTFPFSRSKPIENGYGLKTVKNVVVPAGGDVPSKQTYRNELDLYFNGDVAEGGTVTGKGLNNHEVSTIDYTPKTIDIEANVLGGDEATIKAFIRSAIQPEATLDDGLTYRWEFGGNITTSRLAALIFKADDSIRNVTLVSPAADVVLSDVELPQIGTITLTVTAV